MPVMSLRDAISSLCVTAVIIGGCRDKVPPPLPIDPVVDEVGLAEDQREPEASPLPTVTVPYDVSMGHYFAFMDSLLECIGEVEGKPLSEHVLVLANPWVIDSLRVTDHYYRLEYRNEFVADPNALTVLHRGLALTVPDSALTARIQHRLWRTVIDVNIPEYKLRIWEGDSLLHTFGVRVGRKERKFLQLAGRTVNLETPIGPGEVVRIEKDPWYINPVDGHRYHATRRDDGRYTKLPRIPWIEPSIAGQRPGALIHPTTNRSTLGRAISNGCVGVAEGDMWAVYYHAPLGTRVVYRYDLRVPGADGDTVVLDDIYGREAGKAR